MFGNSPVQKVCWLVKQSPVPKQGLHDPWIRSATPLGIHQHSRIVKMLAVACDEFLHDVQHRLQPCVVYLVFCALHDDRHHFFLLYDANVTCFG